MKLVDAWDRTRGLTDFAGGTIVVFYEDKDTAAQSQQVKDALRTAKTGDGRALPITVIPIADVKGYDYWPARGFVKDAVKKETKKVGQIIYLDWDGKAAQALSAQHGEASVIVYGKNGKVLASHGGAFTEGDARDFVAAVKSDL